MREYDSLRQFLELVRTLHFGRAAQRCHLSPSALSRAIQRLEAQVGQALVKREHHKVTVTPAGEAFRRYAAGMLDEWAQFKRNREATAAALTGTLNVYCTVTAAQSIVPDVLARFREAHPGVRLELATGYAVDALEQLRGGTIDVTVAALPRRLAAGIASHVIATTPAVFVAPMSRGSVRGSVERRRIDWSAIPLVLPASGLAREFIDDWLERRSVSPTIYAEIQGHEAILSLVALGCGVGVVPRLVLEKSALRDRVVELDVRPALPNFKLAICVRERSRANPLVRALWDAVTGAGTPRSTRSQPLDRRPPSALR
jgi:LysR family positive regulator for ilvC